ncbi:MAG: ABC transporter ATP-binding protein [Phycisphaerales bacterium]|nr:ABC transporter ATP-binding protein [Phycisphaerales bacterium]
MSASKPVSIDLEGISKVFPGGVSTVDGIDLSIPGGRVTALLGPTGCGKTTLLRMIGGLVEPTAGTIRCSHPDPVTGYCFQEPRLLPWRSVAQNVGLPLELQGQSLAERAPAVNAVLELVGLREAYDRLPAALSGGMRMRTSLARALVSNPELLLLDEPFGALDEVTRYRLDEEVAELVRQSAMTVLLVTHSITEAVFLADQVIVLSPQPCRIVERFPINFEARTAELRGHPKFGALVSRVYDTLRTAMGDGP